MPPVYIALHIRANKIGLRAESRRSKLQITAGAVTSIIDNREVAGIFREGPGDPSTLSPDDFVRFSFLLGQYVATESGAYDEARIGSAPEETLKRRMVALAAFLNTPGGRAYWQPWAAVYPEDLRSYVEEEVLRPEGAAFPPCSTSHAGTTSSLRYLRSG